MKPVRLIAEAGVNHNGNADLAFKLVEAAHDAGADFIKFQTFKTENLVLKQAPKAEYQKDATGESQFDMLKRLELGKDLHFALKAHAESLGLSFLSTAFDFQSLRLLVDELGLNILKIPSGELTNGPFLLAHAQTDCQLILSTGMASLAEVELALGVLAFGFIGADKPCKQAFMEAYASCEGQRCLKQRVTLLHCSSEYPAPFSGVNLRAMDTLKNAFDLEVGYSDHTPGTAVSIAAVARGASLIEKHFTLDKNLPGPDHKASLDIQELKSLASDIQAVALSLGDGVKRPSSEEFAMRKVARKSLVTLKPVSIGERFTVENLGAMRPGSGISPMDYWHWLGRVSMQNYLAGEILDE